MTPYCISFAGNYRLYQISSISSRKCNPSILHSAGQFPKCNCVLRLELANEWLVLCLVGTYTRLQSPGQEFNLIYQWSLPKRERKLNINLAPSKNWIRYTYNGWKQWYQWNLLTVQKTGNKRGKGQLISKCPFGFIRNNFVGNFVQTMKPKGHFEINWPLGRKPQKL